MTKSAPVRVAIFVLLVVGMLVISVGLSGQLLRLGSMLTAVSLAPSPLPAVAPQPNVPFSPEALLTPAGKMMNTFQPGVLFFASLISAGLLFWVVARWLRTPVEMRGEFLKMMFLYEALAVGVIVVLFPFFWMVCTSFKPSGTELKVNLANPFDVVPADPTLDNFKKVLKIEPGKAETNPAAETPEEALERKKNFGTYFLNSIQIASIAAFFVTLFAAMGGYVFAKKELPYKNVLFGFFMATMMIPGMMYMVPQFFMICKMGLFGTKWAMFLPHLASVFGVFMLKQFMETIPSSLIEAARIDGASEWQIFRIVIVPLSMPILLTLFLLTFLFHWSNFLWQLIVTDFENPLSVTLPVGLALFRGQYTSDLGLIMSASCFSIVPIAVLFLFAQRYFIEGMTQGAVKE
ncbi:MAG: carbohydrate ABC transporter permease [Candidatus Ozemobacteraceae bacterium]